MKLFKFLKKEPSKNLSVSSDNWNGKDFEFLLAGEINLPHECDELLTPKSFEWSKFYKDNWPHYKVGNDYYTFSVEMPGLQMAFNNEIPYQKAKQIAFEVIQKLKLANQQVEFMVVPSNQITRFDY